MENKKENMISEIVIPRGYRVDEFLDTGNEYTDEELIYEEEVKIKFER